MFEVRTLSNLNANFVTSLAVIVQKDEGDYQQMNSSVDNDNRYPLLL